MCRVVSSPRFLGRRVSGGTIYLDGDEAGLRVG